MQEIPLANHMIITSVRQLCAVETSRRKTSGDGAPHFVQLQCEGKVSQHISLRRYDVSAWRDMSY